MLFIYSDKAIVVIYTWRVHGRPLLHQQCRPPCPFSTASQSPPLLVVQKIRVETTFFFIPHASGRRRPSVISSPLYSLSTVSSSTQPLRIVPNTSPSISCTRRVFPPPFFWPVFQSTVIFRYFFSRCSHTVVSRDSDRYVSTADDNNSGNQQPNPVAPNLGPYTTLSTDVSQRHPRWTRISKYHIIRVILKLPRTETEKAEIDTFCVTFKRRCRRRHLVSYRRIKARALRTAVAYTYIIILIGHSIPQCVCVCVKETGRGRRRSRCEPESAPSGFRRKNNNKKNSRPSPGIALYIYICIYTHTGYTR